ncbi:hypothetical protein HDV05_006717 [Chytridiales sp. JEL 0842]|nr:hypothetical protein HDV05_006717 [Chytridiales sp. JEL 0842]
MLPMQALFGTATTGSNAIPIRPPPSSSTFTSGPSPLPAMSQSRPSSSKSSTASPRSAEVGPQADPTIYTVDVTLNPATSDVEHLRKNMIAICPKMTRIVFENINSCKLTFQTHFEALEGIAVLTRLGVTASLAKANYVSVVKLNDGNEKTDARFVVVLNPYWVPADMSVRLLSAYHGIKNSIRKCNKSGKHVIEFNSASHDDAKIYAEDSATSQLADEQSEMSRVPAPLVPSSATTANLIPYFSQWTPKERLQLDHIEDTNCIRVKGVPSELLSNLFGGLQGFKSVKEYQEESYAVFSNEAAALQSVQTLRVLTTFIDHVAKAQLKSSDDLLAKATIHQEAPVASNEEVDGQQASPPKTSAQQNAAANISPSDANAQLDTRMLVPEASRSIKIDKTGTIENGVVVEVDLFKGAGCLHSSESGEILISVDLDAIAKDRKESATREDSSVSSTVSLSNRVAIHPTPLGTTLESVLDDVFAQMSDGSGRSAKAFLQAGIISLMDTSFLKDFNSLQKEPAKAALFHAYMDVLTSNLPGTSHSGYTVLHIY